MRKAKFTSLLGVVTALVLSAAACAHVEGEDGGIPTDTPPTTGTNPNTGGNQNPNAAPLPTVVVDGRISARIDPYACVSLPENANGQPPNTAYLLHCDQSAAQRLLHDANQRLKNAAGTVCLTALAAVGNAPMLVQPAACDSNLSTQAWQLNAGRWSTAGGNLCLQLRDGATGDSSGLQVAACGNDTAQMWDYTAPHTAAVVDPLASATTVSGRCNANVFVSFDGLDAAMRAAFVAAQPDFAATVRAIVQQDCNLMFAAPETVPIDRAALRVDLTSANNDFVYASTSKSIGFPVGYYLGQIAAGSPNEALGLVHQTVASFYIEGNANEAPWIRQGLWFYPRIRTGGLRTSLRVKTGFYTEGSYTAGFFFDWMDRTYPGVVLAMVAEMQRSGAPITEAFFQNYTKQASLSAMWTAYINSF